MSLLVTNEEYKTQSYIHSVISAKCARKTHWKKIHQNAIGLGVTVPFSPNALLFYFFLLIHLKICKGQDFFREARLENSCLAAATCAQEQRPLFWEVNSHRGARAVISSHM